MPVHLTAQAWENLDDQIIRLATIARLNSLSSNGWITGRSRPWGAASRRPQVPRCSVQTPRRACAGCWLHRRCCRSEEHTSELQSRLHLVCRLLLEKKKIDI